jgi:6-pyruvoyltetrahydropterin/6-carboxytetrahydropterin synthase
MYALAVRRNFIARHFLIGGEWGRENFPNSHQFALELELEGEALDVHGYLVDIVDVEKHVGEVIEYFSEKMLNELPEFKGINPSLEHFARILGQTLNERIQAKNISGLKVRLWENEAAWASFAVQRTSG